MICIINSGGANIASIQFALKKLGYDSLLTTDHEIIKTASHVILPGVGSAKFAMQRLLSLSLDKLIPQLTQPVLGICLGMQLLFEYSEEGDVDCLGILEGNVQRLLPMDGLTIPHMGWNTLHIVKHRSPLLHNVIDGNYCYFVHSFAAPINDATLVVSEHGIPFSAVVGKNNFYGMQFHPERSQQVGKTFLTNFLNLKV
jgi:glutamine amidotransferase